MAFVSIGPPRPCRVCTLPTETSDRVGPIHPYCEGVPAAAHEPITDDQHDAVVELLRQRSAAERRPDEM